MATTKQLQKQIETANKRIADFGRKIEMYRARTEKACNAANVSMNDIITKENVIGRFHSFDYVFPDEIQARIDFEVSFRIRNNYTYMKENERNLDAERRNLARLQEELAILQAKDDAERKAFNAGLRAALDDSMKGFKEEWVKRMMDWFDRHFDFIDTHKDEARKAYNRAWNARHYFQWRKGHARTFTRLEYFCKAKSEIFTDPAAHMEKEAYLEQEHAHILKSWESGLDRLTKKCQGFGVDEKNVTVTNPEMTSKGFEVIINDGKPRRIYARVIWAAEYSDIVEPHTRYIVTEKKTK